MFKWKDGRLRAHRPIDTKLPEVDSLLKNHQVVIVEAPTGSGKTSRLGQYLMLEHPDWKIWMSQLKRPAVRSNARFISSELGQRVGRLVGYRLRGEKPMVSDQTRMTLVIDQTLVNIIRRTGKLPKGLLIIDEAHHRSIPTDLLLKMIKELLPSSPDTRVIITSATIDTKKFSEYFGGAPVVSAHGRMWPVEVIPVNFDVGHHSSVAIEQATELMEQYAKGALTVITREAAREIMQTEDRMREAGESEWRIKETIVKMMKEADREVVKKGAIALVLAGKDDIANAMSALRRKAKQLSIEDHVEVVECHSQVTADQQDIVTEVPVAQNTIRFVCATDIIRDSITPRELIGLIDQLQAKRPFVDAKGVPHLDKIQISLAEAVQGMGRPGRTGPGMYFPVSHKGEYPNKLPQWPLAAILREALTSVTLQVAAMGYDIRDGGFIDDPNPKKVEAAVIRLIKVGALTPEGKITKIGRMLVQFTTDPEPARALITADQLDVLAEAMIASKVYDEEGIMFRPREIDSKVIVSESIARKLIAESMGTVRDPDGRRRPATSEDVDLDNCPSWVIPLGDDKYEIDCGNSDFTWQVSRYGTKHVADLVWREFAAGSGSDFVASVNAFRAFKAEEFRLRDLGRELREEAINRGETLNGTGSYRWREGHLFQWCKDHFVNFKAARRVDNGLRQLKEDISNSPLRMKNGLYEQQDFDHEALAKALASGLVDHVHRNAGRRSFVGPMSTKDEGDPELAFSSVCPSNSAFILIGGVRKIAQLGRRGTTYHTLLATMACPLKPEWLEEVMPQLCEPRFRAGTAEFEPETGIVKGIEDVYYGNVVIRSRTIQVKGEEAAKAIAKAMMSPKTGLPAEWLAKAYINQVEKLSAREGVYRSIKDQIEKWLLNRLIAGEATTREEAQALDLMLTDDDISKMLGFDYPEYRERVKAENPLVVSIGGRQCALKYAVGPWSSASVRITVPFLLAYRLNPEMFPDFGDREVRVRPGKDKYTYIQVPVEKLEEFKLQVEKRRRELAWAVFKNNGHGDYDRKVYVAYSASFPALPAPEIWDPVTKDEAFPAFVYSSYASGEDAKTSWYIHWYQTEEQAVEANAAAEAKRIENDDDEYERRHLDELKAKAKKLHEEISNLWAQVDTDKYQAYGLKEKETRTDWYASEETSIPKGLDWAQELAISSPMQAIKRLELLKERVEAALAHFAEGQERRPEAEATYHAARFAAHTVEQFGDEVDPDGNRAEIDELIAKAEKAFEGEDYITALERSQSALELAKPLQEQVEQIEKRAESGEILLHFGGHFRHMGVSGNGDFWVIRADGSLREPDNIKYRKRYRSEGDKYWTIVGAEELALSWTCGTTNDIAGSSEFVVAKLPVNGLTATQLETVTEIELDIGAPQNAFGLDEQMQKMFGERLAQIKVAVANSPLINEVPDLDYLTVTGEWGQLVGDYCIRGQVEDYVDEEGEFPVSIENRRAQVLDQQPAAGGVVEFLAYFKYGDWNLNIRWRELAEGESLTQRHSQSIVAEPDAVKKPFDDDGSPLTGMATELANAGVLEAQEPTEPEYSEEPAKKSAVQRKKLERLIAKTKAKLEARKLELAEEEAKLRANAINATNGEVETPIVMAGQHIIASFTPNGEGNSVATILDWGTEREVQLLIPEEQFGVLLVEIVEEKPDLAYHNDEWKIPGVIFLVRQVDLISGDTKLIEQQDKLEKFQRRLVAL